MPDSPIIQTTVQTATIIVGQGDEAQVIETGIIGPQGPIGPVGPVGPPGSNYLVNLNDVDATAVVDKSVLVYNGTTSKFTADDANTTITLTDGGNF